ELHDALSRTGIAPALVLAQAAADESLISQHRSSTSVAWSEFAAAARQRILLLEFQIGGLDDVGEDLDVAVDLLAELLAGPAAGIARHRLELLAHPAIGERAPHLRIELVRDRRRRAGRDEYAAPEPDIHLRVACLRHARHVREFRGALRSGHCKGADLAALHQRHRGWTIGDREQ